MLMQNLLSKCETKPTSFHVVTATIQALSDIRQMLCSNTRPCVADRTDNSSFVVAHNNIHPITRTTVLHGIVKNIQENAHNLVGIAQGSR